MANVIPRRFASMIFFLNKNKEVTNGTLYKS